MEFLAFLDLKQIAVRLEDRERILSTGQTNRLLLFRPALLPIWVDVALLPGLPLVELGRVLLSLVQGQRLGLVGDRLFLLRSSVLLG